MTSAPWSTAQTMPSMMSLSWPSPSASRTVTGMTLTPSNPMPAIPRSLSVTAAMIPAIAVPWPLGSTSGSPPGSRLVPGDELPGEVGMARIDARVEDGHDCRAGRVDGAVDVVPADPRQRPLLVVAWIARGGLGGADGVALDPDDAGVGAQRFDDR